VLLVVLVVLVVLVCVLVVCALLLLEEELPVVSSSLPHARIATASKHTVSSRRIEPSTQLE
jgi:hypothetical protein